MVTVWRAARRQGIGWGWVGVAAVPSPPPLPVNSSGSRLRLFSLVTLCPGKKQHTVFLLNLCVNCPMLCIIILSEHQVVFRGLIGMKTRATVFSFGKFDRGFVCCL